MPQVFRDDDNTTDPSYSNVDAAREDRQAAHDEETGTISQQEIQDLGGRANIMNDSSGVQTRGKKIDSTKADREIDQAVDNATNFDYETGGQETRS